MNLLLRGIPFDIGFRCGKDMLCMEEAEMAIWFIFLWVRIVSVYTELSPRADKNATFVSHMQQVQAMITVLNFVDYMYLHCTNCMPKLLFYHAKPVIRDNSEYWFLK